MRCNFVGTCRHICSVARIRGLEKLVVLRYLGFRSQSLAPPQALCLRLLPQAYRLTGKFQEALNAFTQALRINPQDPVVHNWLGLTYESLERKQEALAAYKRAIELKPDYAEAHYNLGVLCLILGDRTQTEQEYSILKDLNSDLAQVLSTKLRQPDPL